MTQTEAILDAIASEMRRDERVFYIGQDVGAMGGSMLGTQGLLAEFGPRRIREAPISESAMVGAAIGAALFGQRPIVEISFGEFIPAAMNQLINQAPNLHYMTGGVARVPLVIRTRVGDGPYGGHPQDYSAWFAHVPGFKVVMPARPSDARGLMLAALRDANPVLYFEPMSLAHAPRERVDLDNERMSGQDRKGAPCATRRCRDRGGRRFDGEGQPARGRDARDRRRAGGRGDRPALASAAGHGRGRRVRTADGAPGDGP